MIRGLAIETSGRLGSVAITDDGIVISEDSFAHGLKHAAEMVPRINRLLESAGWKPGNLREIYVSVGPGSFTGLRIGITLAKTLSFATGARIVAVPTLEVLARNAPAEACDVVIVLDAKRDQIFTARLHRGLMPTGGDASTPSPPYSGVRGNSSSCAARKNDPSPQPSPPGTGAREPEVARNNLDSAAWQIVEPAHLDSLTAMLARSPRPVWLIGEGIPFHEKFVPANDSSVIVTTEESWRASAAVVADLGHWLAREGTFTQAETLTPLYIRKPEAEEKYDSK